MENKKRVVIIGAGPAGLTAAWELVTKAGDDYEVTVLEAEGYVGGMAKSVSCNGNIMDVGGHRFFSKEKVVLDWWKAFFQRNGKMSELMLRNRKVSIYYDNKFFDYPITLDWNNIKKLGVLNACKAGIAYLVSFISPRNEKSLEDFYMNRFGKTLYAMFFKNYTQKLCGVHPTEISPEWGKQRVRGLSAGKILRERFDKKGWQTKEGLLSPSLFYYPKYGPGQLWSAVAEEIVQNGGIIRLNCKVCSLQQKEDNTIEFVTVESENGIETVKGDILISSMPLNKMVAGMNLASENIKRIAEELPYRNFVSIGLVVDKVLLDAPDCWIYVHNEDVQACRVQFYKNWSPYLVDEPEKRSFLALEYFCNENDEIWSMSKEECMKLAVQEAVKLKILDDDVEVFSCYKECIAQAYPGYYGAYEQVEKVRVYLDGIDNLFCIGRNGQHRYWNMDKCMISAWNVVEQILHLESKQEF